MRRYALLLLFLVLPAIWAFGQAPIGFNYQAAIYQDGAPVANQSVNLRLDLVDANGNVYYQETCNGIETDAVGLVNVLIGQGDPDKMASAPWGKGLWVAAYVDLGSGLIPLGKVKLQAVPYALHASAGMTIQAPDDYAADAPLFQILNKKGEPIFSVSESQTLITVNDASASDALATTAAGRGTVVNQTRGIQDRGVRGGFIVQTRGGAGRAPVDRMHVGTGVEFNVDDGSRGIRGGFLVNTRTQVPSRGGDFIYEYAPRVNIASGSVNFFVEESEYVQDRAGGVRGGFVVNLNSQRYRGNAEFAYSASRPLLFLGQRESFLTVGTGSADCGGGVKSTFSLRDRCNPHDEVIMQVKSDGKIGTATSDKEIGGIDISLNKGIKYRVLKEIKFSKLIRWWSPSETVQVSVDGEDKGALSTGYRIELDEDLKKYLEIVPVKTVLDGKNKEVSGLHIKSDKLNEQNIHLALLDKKIRVVSEADPSCYAELRIIWEDVSKLVMDNAVSNPIPNFQMHAMGGDTDYHTSISRELQMNFTTLLNEGTQVLEQSITPALPGVPVPIETGYWGEVMLTCKVADVKKNIADSEFDSNTGFTKEYTMTLKDKVTKIEGKLTFQIQKPLL